MASYVDAATADTLLTAQAPSLRKAWDVASPSDREDALSTASLLIDQEFCFLGKATTDTQDLAWPRTGVSYIDPAKGVKVDVPDNIVPDRVKLATALLGAHILRYGDAVFGYEPTAASVGLESINVSLVPKRVPRIPTVVRRLLSPLLDGRYASARQWFMAN